LKAMQGPFLASRNVVRPLDYFWLSDFRWLTDYASRTPVRPETLAVQIDFAIWIPIALALPFLLVAVVRQRHALGTRRSLPVMVFLFGSLMVYMFLQLPAAKPIYRTVRTLELLQFPWRLMAFIIPLGIVVVVMLADAVYHRSSRIAALVMPVLSIGWLASLIVLSPLLSTFRNYGFIPSPLLVAPRYQTFGRPPLLYDAEYLPQVKKQSSLTTLLTYGRLLATHDLAEPLSGNTRNSERGGGAESPSTTKCTVVEPKSTDFESLRIQLTVTCNEPTILALPISYNAYTTISVGESKGRWRPVSYLHIPSDPRIAIEVSSTKSQVLLITLPTVWHVLF